MFGTQKRPQFSSADGKDLKRLWKEHRVGGVPKPQTGLECQAMAFVLASYQDIEFKINSLEVS